MTYQFMQISSGLSFMSALSIIAAITLVLYALKFKPQLIVGFLAISMVPFLVVTMVPSTTASTSDVAAMEPWEIHVPGETNLQERAKEATLFVARVEKKTADGKILDQKENLRLRDAQILIKNANTQRKSSAAIARLTASTPPDTRAEAIRAKLNPPDRTRDVPVAPPNKVRPRTKTSVKTTKPPAPQKAAAMESKSETLTKEAKAAEAKKVQQERIDAANAKKAQEAQKRMAEKAKRLAEAKKAKQQAAVKKPTIAKKVAAKQKMVSTKKPDLLSQYATAEAKRLALTPQSKQGLAQIAKFVSEQGDNGISAQALNGGRSLFTPTMNGVYEGSPLHTAINRLHAYSNKHNLEVPKWANHDLYKKTPEKFYTVSTRDQAALVMISFAQQRGTDALIVQAATGDIQATEQLYLKFHHKAPQSDPGAWQTSTS